MPMNNEIPTGRGEPDDHKWNALLQEYAATPVAPAPRRRRPWLLNTALVLVVVGSAFGVLKLTGSSSPDTRAAAPAPRNAGSAAPTPSTPSTPTASAPSASHKGSAAARPMIPLGDLFPAEVRAGSGATFTRLGSAVMTSCPEPGGVGPRLAALIDDSAGCVGEQVALYKDGQDNQFNLAVFTMKDPQDTVKLVTELGMAFDDYQVAVQGPPPASGLPTLPADSGLVQAFTGHGRVMVVAMAQWSDGRTADFRQLVDRMGPLQEAISKKAGAYEDAA
ncbi:hypothetical protein [Streptomyces sp. NBC_01565]|uniref:hypothetical protein n=1 Tax=unclassified Streptomyces TaxID=2593676 RepID=UPI00224F3D04|nr:hypothetical protein [Streptomyces sp. NBC_01565]MCX4546106.1 hypothetical protein [Streptomyces sp. NBC_01565]